MQHTLCKLIHFKTRRHFPSVKDGTWSTKNFSSMKIYCFFSKNSKILLNSKYSFLYFFAKNNNLLNFILFLFHRKLCKRRTVLHYWWHLQRKGAIHWGIRIYVATVMPDATKLYSHIIWTDWMSASEITGEWSIWPFLTSLVKKYFWPLERKKNKLWGHQIYILHYQSNWTRPIWA